MSEPARPTDPLSALLRKAVELDDAERRRARVQFLDRVEPRLRRENRWYWIGVCGIPVAVALGLLLWYRATSIRGLDYTVVGASRSGDYVHVGQTVTGRITFSDHTEIHAAPGARLRIADNAGPDGAKVSVERGRLDVAVVHRKGSNWRFEAGPFKVFVTGTRFVLSWEPDREQLEVILTEGSVNVEGYAGSGTVTVNPGQRFVGDAKRRTMLVADSAAPSEPSEPPGSPEPAASASAETAPPTPRATSVISKPMEAPTTSGASASQKPSWAALVSKGAYRQVVEAATARGTEQCLATGTGEELSALADAARYVGRGDLAERSLLSLRKRHAAGYGVRAAFLLGRLYEGRGDRASAKSYYETTLREGAGGAFAAEALAGKMRTVASLEGRASARVVAREYLRLYPNGVHAPAAKQLAESP
jgi:hypothetical protein